MRKVKVKWRSLFPNGKKALQKEVDANTKEVDDKLSEVDGKVDDSENNRDDLENSKQFTCEACCAEFDEE